MPKETMAVKTSVDMRQEADRIARGQPIDYPEAMAELRPDVARTLLHELRVHQIELEMQNEELRRVQERLEKSRERYYDLYNLAPVGYFSLNETGLILEANRTAAALLDVTQGALGRQQFTHFILSDDQDAYYLARQKLMATGVPQTSELRMMRKNALPFWVRIEASLAQDIAGSPVYLVVMSDIDDRKRAEDEMLRVNELLDETQAIAKLGGWDYDVTTGHMAWTREVYKIYGVDNDFDPTDVTQNLRFYTKESAKKLDRAFQNALDHGEPFDLVLNFIRASGERIWVQTTGHPQFKEGRVHRIRGTFRDITERTRAEELHEEIERIVHHDLRSPAIAAVSVARLLTQSQALSSRDRELVTDLERSGQWMLDTLNQSLDLYKLETGQYDYVPQLLDALDIVHEVVRILELQSDMTGKTMEVVAAATAPAGGFAYPAKGEPFLLRMALQNLILNALEASPPRGKVVVSLIRDQWLTIAIHNSGAVPSDIRRKFFEKYATSGKAFGTGLGTYSAKKMIEAQGGTIAMQTSDDADTTTVTIHMPS